MTESEKFEDFCINTKNVDPKSLWGLCMRDGWQARQPEIDALKAEVAHLNWRLVDEILSRQEKEAEVEKLRNAAKPVIDYWFEDGEARTQESDCAAFLELSNAYYRRENRMSALPDTKGE